MDKQNVIFITLAALPTFENKYVGWHILVGTKYYIGTSEGWHELTDSKVGDITELKTSVKTDVVAAVNELFDEIDGVNEILENVLYEK